MSCPICLRTLPTSITHATATVQDCPYCQGEIVINEWDEISATDRCDLWSIYYVADSGFDQKKSCLVWADDCSGEVAAAKMKELKEGSLWGRGKLVLRNGEPPEHM